MSCTATLIRREVDLIEAIDNYVYSDGVTEWRRIMRGTYMAIDKAITPTGFAGAQGTDWVEYEQIL